MNLNNIDSFIKEFQDSFDENIIIGNQIKIENIILIPLINISFAYGTSKDSPKNKNSGLYLGSNVYVSGILIVKDGKISFLSTREKTPLENISESIGNFYSKDA
ncbi:spore germination protein GerW family protein [Clostridium cochlearium]|uniref:Sporulation protein YtfJ (Spore_YtfJ) n=1 Tax=Clostridium cochlearium TaxID=1494 RepID=A0A1G9H6V4_CLOCO|nr:spore germination protein GerW family protein [Clostridium cochlearium]MBV1820481.1 hypothetical protein [Bacteroidales bacterium MSK.15.36]NSJ91890.1 hypothetical protein [Coprococcus sp. MSK.21.13]MCG4570757.1 hypothetical protein [Clostridium cochlearium]MCG4579532.1 hypothetical protein [Clostridium cochlearium]MCR1970455.1 spore germination protein GerW family protein [Clostridium cochlearium]